MLWKELHTRRAARFGLLGRVAGLLLVLSVVTLATWQFVEALQLDSNYWRTPAYYFIVTIAGWLGTSVASLGLLLLAARSACSITSEKDKDTWLSLLATSLEPADIVNAKLLGNLYSQRFIVLLLLYIWGLTAFLDLGFLLAVPFLLATYGLLAFFVSAVGIYFSLRAKNSLAVLAATLALVVFVGGGYLFTCCLPVLMTGGGNETMALILGGCMPFLMAAPAFIYAEGSDLLRREGILIVAYALGVFFYLLAGFAVWSTCIEVFESITGRTHLPRNAPRALRQDQRAR